MPSKESPRSIKAITAWVRARPGLRADYRQRMLYLLARLRAVEAEAKEKVREGEPMPTEKLTPTIEALVKEACGNVNYCVCDEVCMFRSLALAVAEKAAREAREDIVLTQFHPIRKGAEVVIKRRSRFQAWAGNLVEVDNPRAYYSPDEGDAIRGGADAE